MDRLRTAEPIEPSRRRGVWRVRWCTYVVLGLLALVACKNVHRIRLVFAGGEDGPRGFRCMEDISTDTYLAERVLPTDGTVSYVVDFLRLGGVPGCRSTEILEWCATQECAPIDFRRRCFSVELPPVTTGEEAAAAVAQATAELEGTPVTSDAPGEPVIVRVVATTQPCEDFEIGAPLAFDCQQLLGCVHSCAVQLDSLVGDVVLALDSISPTCTEAEVVVCASTPTDWTETCP